MIPGFVCDNRKFFARLETQCRKNPPSMVPVPDPRGGLRFIGTWPPTAKDKWCGSFEAEIEKGLA